MEEYVDVATSNPIQKALNDGVKNVFQSLYKNPLLRSPNLVTGISIGTSDTIINHRLGRPVVGYLICQSYAATNVYTSSTVNSNPNIQIILKASVATTVDILFF